MTGRAFRQTTCDFWFTKEALLRLSAGSNAKTAKLSELNQDIIPLLPAVIEQRIFASHLFVGLIFRVASPNGPAV